MSVAVAVDLGASSGRVAVGRLVNGAITFEIVDQRTHNASDNRGRLEWDITTLRGLCELGREVGRANGAKSLGIDSWGVDHGFLNASGELIAAPVCYRDESHAASFEALKSHRDRLFSLTGIQHQPFNTIYQLHARLQENPRFLNAVEDWMILPDLLGYLLTGERNTEFTQASTTQLMGLDGTWSDEAFAVIGWPTPKRQPMLPGQLGAEFAPGFRLAHVGSHDTASAVLGFGALGPTDLFLNIGTWTLVGCVLDAPNVSDAARSGNFSNERCVDGRVRFLRNIPGFYIINRTHEELGITRSVPEWLSTSVQVSAHADVLGEQFFNPDSMLDALAESAGFRPQSHEEWAGLALSSMIAAVGAQPEFIRSSDPADGR